MKSALAVVMLAVLMALPVAAYANGAWLGTGVVTKINGNTFYLLSGDNNVYQIDGAGAQVFVGETGNLCCDLIVGQRVRVYGVQTAPKLIKAERVRVLDAGTEGTGQPASGADKIVKVIVERPAPVAGAGPAEEPATSTPEPNWSGMGLITSINYLGRQINMRTSTGGVSILVGNIPIIDGVKTIGLGLLNEGDAIRVQGIMSGGLNQVRALSITLLRSKSESESTPPQYPVSVAGIIRQVDYPSFTFTMTTGASPITVMADHDTIINEHHERMAFMNLRPGMKIKMSGYGSIATGYMAQHIQIIGTAP